MQGDEWQVPGLIVAVLEPRRAAVANSSPPLTKPLSRDGVQASDAPSCSSQTDLML